MTSHSPPATNVVIYSSLPLWFSRNERSVALFLPEASLTRSSHSPGVSRRAGGASAPDAKRDQAECEQHGGKQGGEGGGHHPEEERHPQQSQQRCTRGTAHRGGQPRRQQREQPRPAPSRTLVASDQQAGGVLEVEAHQDGEHERGRQAPPGRGQPDMGQRRPDQNRCEGCPGLRSRPGE